MTAGIWSEEALRILALFRHGGTYHGWGVCKATGVPAGTAYPILKRFETQGLVSARHERVDPTLSSRVPKVFYTISTGGQDRLGSLRAILMGSST